MYQRPYNGQQRTRGRGGYRGRRYNWSYHQNTYPTQRRGGYQGRSRHYQEREEGELSPVRYDSSSKDQKKRGRSRNPEKRSSGDQRKRAKVDNRSRIRDHKREGSHSKSASQKRSATPQHSRSRSLSKQSRGCTRSRSFSRSASPTPQEVAECEKCQAPLNGMVKMTFFNCAKRHKLCLECSSQSAQRIFKAGPKLVVDLNDKNEIHLKAAPFDCPVCELKSDEEEQGVRCQVCNQRVSAAQVFPHTQNHLRLKQMSKLLLHVNKNPDAQHVVKQLYQDVQWDQL